MRQDFRDFIVLPTPPSHAEAPVVRLELSRDRQQCVANIGADVLQKLQRGRVVAKDRKVERYASTFVFEADGVCVAMAAATALQHPGGGAGASEEVVRLRAESFTARIMPLSSSSRSHKDKLEFSGCARACAISAGSDSGRAAHRAQP